MVSNCHLARLSVLLFLVPALQAEDVESKVGQSFDIFHRFGFLKQGFKVLPGRDSEIIKEPTKPVFNETDVIEEELSGVYENEFHIHFCSTPSELLSLYFKHFSIAGTLRTWKAFFTYDDRCSNCAFRKLAESYFGLRSWHIKGDYRFGFVRIYRKDRKYKLSNRTRVVNPRYESFFEDVYNEKDYFKIVDRVGSHYIDSIEIGDFLYQVFVFDQFTYSYIVNSTNSTYFVTSNSSDFAKDFFNNWYVSYFGPIRAASDNNRLNRLLRSDAFKEPRYIFGSYYSIFKLEDEELRRQAGAIKTSMITSMSLEPVSELIRNDRQRSLFENWLLNFMQLWETSL